MRELIWSRTDSPGMEHFRISHSADEVLASGVVVGANEDSAFRLEYSVHCDSLWRVRRVEVSLIGDDRGVAISSDGEGNWTDAAGDALPRLDGCTDVDITATPFTNTLPIRRLELEPGKSASIRVAYINVPTMTVEPDEQRYTSIASDKHGGTYRFEQIATGFTADIQVGPEGLITHYPGLFERVWSN